MTKLVGYARVSTTDQDLSMQLDELKAAGCVRIFSEKISTRKEEREELNRCMAALEPGDTLIVWKLDRLGRSLSDLVNLVTLLRERGVGFRSLRDGAIDTTTASGELVFHIFAALAQFERELTRERTKAGLAAARARGRMGGRKPVLETDPKVRAARKMHEDKTMTIREICRTLHISRATLYRYLSIGTNGTNNAKKEE